VGKKKKETETQLGRLTKAVNLYNIYNNVERLITYKIKILYLNFNVNSQKYYKNPTLL
jgi:hypothetical protein